MARDHVRSFGILSTFPPTSCGIATFSAALANGLITDGSSVGVVRCGPSPEVEDVLVTASLTDMTPHRSAAAIDALNANDVVLVQHEYGLYDGPDVDLAKVSLVPHGATTTTTTPILSPLRSDRPVRLLTWGLLGPGKGIEWAIDALGELGDLDPRPEYIVAGATHPKVREREGERYREMLVARAARSTHAGQVIFDDQYRDLRSLTELIESADVVVLPYDSRDQVTSGVLVDAVAAGRPVISTAFPHAVELLSSGAGIVVPQRDPAALGAAIRSVLTEPRLAASMAREARRLAPSLSWPAVAHQYSVLGSRLVRARTAVAS